MTNRPKSIGTFAETAVVRAARASGFPNADRLTLTGNKDRGDIGLCPGVIVEVKAGKVAEQCADAWLAEAQRQTLTEQGHSGAAVALLVCKRKAVGAANAGQWWAWMPAEQLIVLSLLCYETDRTMPDMWVRMTLAEALLLLRHAGYGDPITKELAA